MNEIKSEDFLFLHSSSALSAALFKFYNETMDKYTVDTKEDEELSFIDKTGEVFFPIKNNNLKEEDLFAFLNTDELHYEEKPKSTEYDYFKRNFISDNLIHFKFDDKKINIIDFLCEASQDSNIYGILIERDEEILNPFHPLISIAILQGHIKLPTEGIIYIFQYSDKIKEISEFIENQFDKHFMNLFEHYSTKKLTKTSVRSTKCDIDKSLIINTIFNIKENINMLDNYSFKLNHTDHSLKNYDGILIPVHVVADGSLRPYYGNILLKIENNKIFGTSNVPFSSGNLQTSRCRIVAEGSGICTGNYNKMTRSGWLSLSRLNATSMFDNNIIFGEDHEIKRYVEKCKEISSEIFKNLKK